jgi:hypothetical protein
MAKRNLRIVRRVHGVVQLGVCEYCNMQFVANPTTNGEVEEGDVRRQFEAHKCKRQDFALNAARIVKETPHVN